MLWDFLLLRGEVVFFQLLMAVFSILQKEMKKINEGKIFESVKKIILKGERQILEKVEKYATKETEILKVLGKNNLFFSQDDN